MFQFYNQYNWLITKQDEKISKEHMQNILTTNELGPNNSQAITRHLYPVYDTKKLWSVTI